MKKMTSSTMFFRNKMQLYTVFDLLESKGSDSPVNAVFYGCADGSEVYTFIIEYLLRDKPFPLKISGYDIVEEKIKLARQKIYELPNDKLPKTIPFYAESYFEVRDKTLNLKIDYPVVFEIRDLQDNKGSQENLADLVSAQNIFIHMEKEETLAGLKKLYDRTVRGGFMLLGGCDLDVLYGFTKDNNLKPITKNIRAIHDSWELRRKTNPELYWHLPALDDSIEGWQRRYATIFQKI